MKKKSKNVGRKNLVEKKIDRKIFFGRNVFRSKNSFQSNFFSAEFFFRPIFLSTEKKIDHIFFGRKCFSIIFFRPKFFRPIFRSKNFPGFQKSYLEQRAYDFRKMIFRHCFNFFRHFSWFPGTPTPPYLGAPRGAWRISDEFFRFLAGKNILCTIVSEHQAIFLLLVFCMSKVCTKCVAKKLSRV